MWRRERKNHGTFGPARIICLDTETVPKTVSDPLPRTWHVLKLACASAGRVRNGALSGERRIQTADVDELWAWIAKQLDQREVTWVFAHNWGFDIESTQWRQILETGEWTLSVDPDEFGDYNLPEGRKKPFRGLWVDQGPPILCSVMHRSGARMLLIDSRNWCPYALETIGRMIGIKKVALPEAGAPDWHWEKRCWRDVEILQAFVLYTIRWVKERDLGVFSYTIAGQAHRHYRHQYNSSGIVFHDVGWVRALERRAYYGGRVELFFRGSIGTAPLKRSKVPRKSRTVARPVPVGPISHLDASALYPAVMHEGLFPRVLRDWVRCPGGSSPDGQALGIDCIAEVDVHTDTLPLPVRTTSGVCWCLGRFRTCLAGPELEYALRAGLVTKVYHYSRYELQPLFRDWAKQVWDWRVAAEDGNRPLEAAMLKLLANALHGKYAQQTPSWLIAPGDICEKSWGTWPERVVSVSGRPGDGNVPDRATWDRSQEAYAWTERRRGIAGVCYREVDREDRESTSPAIAAYVASYAREWVRGWMEIAGPGQVLAVHTDALLVSLEGRQRLEMAGEIHPRSLGKLRLKGEAETAECLGCNWYSVGNESHRSGVSHRATINPDGSYTSEFFQTLSAATFYDPGPGVLLYETTRKPPQKYIKGREGPDGWIDPHRLPKRGIDVLSGPIT